MSSPSSPPPSRPETPILGLEPTLNLPAVEAIRTRRILPLTTDANRDRDRTDSLQRGKPRILPMTYILACEIKYEAWKDSIVEICVEFDSHATKERHEKEAYANAMEIIRYIVREKHNKELAGEVGTMRPAIEGDKVDIKLSSNSKEQTSNQ